MDLLPQHAGRSVQSLKSIDVGRRRAAADHVLRWVCSAGAGLCLLAIILGDLVADVTGSTPIVLGIVLVLFLGIAIAPGRASDLIDKAFSTLGGMASKK